MPALLALLAALGQLPPAQLAQPAQTVDVRANLAELDTAEKTLRAEGKVVLQSGGLRLLAEELEYGTETRAGSAGGGLVLIDGDVAVSATEGTYSLQGEGSLSLEEAQLWQKAPGSQAQLLKATDAASARSSGRNLVLLKAEHLDRVAKGRYLARKLRMTSCDCGAAVVPDWSLSASEADIEPGERAILWWPTVYIKTVPVFILPALYVPLSNRRTGFLFPRPGYSGQNGFLIDEPFFWALNESWDLTFTLGYRFGLSPAETATASGQTLYSRAGSKGVRGSVELRYAPVEGTWGRLYVAAIDDRHGDPTADGTSLRSPRGFRGELSFRHATELDGFGVRADVNLVSDANYLSDEAVDVLRDVVPYVRSQAWAGYRGANGSAELATAFYQDMRYEVWASSLVPEHWFSGKDAPALYHRPIALVGSVPQTQIVGPLRAGMDIAAARYQPVSAFTAPAPDVDLSLTRLDVSPYLAWPMALGPIHGELYARGRGDLSAYTGPSGLAGTATGTEVEASHLRALIGGWLGTEISRTFLDGTLKHTVEPRIELRAGSPRWGNEPTLTGLVAPLDEFDERADGFVQGQVALATRLLRKGKGELVRLEVGQDVDLRAGKAADTFARLDVSPRYVGASATARYDWALRRVALVGAGLHVDDGRGDVLSLGYDHLAFGGTDRMRAGLDQLFGFPIDQTTSTDQVFNQISLSLGVTIISGISLRYAAAMNPDQPLPFFKRILQHSGGLTLTTGCDCWKVDVYATYAQTGSYNIGFLVDLKNLGSFGH
jgi:LPS-assembly protein